MNFWSFHLALRASGTIFELTLEEKLDQCEPPIGEVWRGRNVERRSYPDRGVDGERRYE
jgi:hypothetical protein